MSMKSAVKRIAEELFGVGHYSVRENRLRVGRILRKEVKPRRRKVKQDVILYLYHHPADKRNDNHYFSLRECEVGGFKVQSGDTYDSRKKAKSVAARLAAKLNLRIVEVKKKYDRIYA